MKNIVYRLIWNSKTKSIVLFLFHLLPIKKGRIMLISWAGKSYNCNPRYIAEAILADNECNEYDLNFAFISPNAINDLPGKIRPIALGSLKYFYYLATSRFIISNVIFAGEYFPEKKKNQIYIHAQHGGRGIKKVDFDDVDHVSLSFLKTRVEDSIRTDLMLADSKYHTRMCRSAYIYTGEVLECGLPRNKFFFIEESEKNRIKQKVRSILNIPEQSKCLIYAPTFRGNGRRDVYGFNEQKVIEALKDRFGGDWYVLIGSHPNMYEFYQEIYDFTNPKVRDVGRYGDFQELLLLSDVLVTDYSSAEMDFSIQEKPVFSLVKDADSYDRGLYLSPKELPFPYAETEETLCSNILNFDNDNYISNLRNFEQEVMGLKETGKASEIVVDWIKTHN